YLAKDEDGKVIETPADLFRRVARNIAAADRLYDKKADCAATEETFYAMMRDFDFLPNSPTLMNAGRELQQLSACFVLPIEDSMDSIFETIKSAALIHKSGGGTGFSFSRLRPKNSTVKTTGGVASGPISFLKVFNAATEAVKQGGTRRGANMGILRVDHPDVLEFVKCKENDKEITNFNVSVAATDNFMDKVIADKDYDLIDPHTKKPVASLRAREVFDLMVKMAWKNGEPGIIFLDRMNQFNPTPEIGMYESTNPCGEQVLLPYESCNLGSVNLNTMVKSDTNEIDWEKLSRTVKNAVHFLDNVIDMNNYPLKKIEHMTKANRKIGLGVMGFADMLIKLGIPYNSEEAIAMAEKVMSFILKRAREQSRTLAKKRGAFPNYEKSIYKSGKDGVLRNATLTTIAPTGTLSIIAGCSSGIEPLFALSFIRKILDNEQLLDVNPYFKDVATVRGFFSPELMKLIAEKGSLAEIEEIPEEVKKVFVIAHDINTVWHVRMQGAFQKYTDNAVSKTINFQHDATEDNIRDAYLMAYKLGCKGITIYRDRSREEQVLNIPSAHQKRSEVYNIVPRPRPAVVVGTTTKITTGCGNLYVTINEDEEHLPFEVFMQMGKAGGCAMSQLEAIGRLLSLALRSGIDISVIVEQLKGIRCPSPSWEKGGRIFSCSDAIARVVEKQLIKAKEEKKSDMKDDVPLYPKVFSGNEEPGVAVQKKLGNIVGVCPDCGAALYQVEGCNICHSCGFSKCG
ncbi:MAG: vitamin B12-dependent ribonucleotide reductase, partial [Candidatus Omnitrophica bacterium]|nr:vitamin B12-dependent ribonucleotide reductase [Candidatus Omnitrophota bacterium]